MLNLSLPRYDSGDPIDIYTLGPSADSDQVDFHQENGSTISNVISEGSEGDLNMTYVFEWLHPQTEAGSAEAGQLHAKYKAIAKMAVEKSIESIRKMVTEGVI